MKICRITNKNLIVGNKISHSNKKHKRKFKINIKNKYFKLNNIKLKLKLSTAGIKFLDKIYNYLNYKYTIKLK